MTAPLRPVATGQTTHERRPGHPYIRPGGRYHLTDGTPASRTGRNLKAVCGVSVRPETPEGIDTGKLCPDCRAEKERRELTAGPGFANFSADDSPAEVERKMGEAFSPLRAARPFLAGGEA